MDADFGHRLLGHLLQLSLARTKHENENIRNCYQLLAYENLIGLVRFVGGGALIDFGPG